MLDIIEAKIKQSISKNLKPFEKKITDIEDAIEGVVVDAIKNIKLKEPKEPKDGKDGKDGRDGKSIKGDKGEQGVAGISIKGDKGDDGIGFESANVNEGGELIIERTDGKIINAGNVKGDKGETLIQYVQQGGGSDILKAGNIQRLTETTTIQNTDVLALVRDGKLLKIKKSNLVTGGGGGSSAFADLTAGTNTTAAMVVGTGASLTATGSGTIIATSTTGNAATVTTNANLTGHVTSVGNAAVLGSFTSAQLRVALTDNTGTGSAVFGTSPNLITPALGTPSAGVLTNCTGTATGLTSGITNALKSATTTVDVSASTAPTIGQVLTATSGTAATWQSPSGGSAFSALTSSTNTTAAMVVGTGASLSASGSGTIVATSCTGNSATVTTNANLTGNVTSVGNATTIANGVITIAMHSATGTPSASTYYRGDNTWATVAGGSSAFTDITTGTNITAIMTVGTGASLGASGSGTIVATSATGNAGTATALQNARTIGGVSFDGTANITVSTATGGFTVSGGDLSVGANNIAITGSIGSTGSRVLKGWFTDLQVTNAIAGSITGNSATVTTNANLTGHITSTGNAAILGSFTKAQLNTAISDDNAAYVGTANAFTVQQNFSQATLTSTTNSIAWDVNVAQTATHTATENTTLANQTNAVAGATYQFTWIQNASAAKTLAFGTNYIFNGSSTVSTTLSSVAIFTFTSDGTKMRGVMTQFAS